MSIKQTAYDTTACKGFVLTRIIHEMKLSLIKGGVQSLDVDNKELSFLTSSDKIKFVVTHPESASVPSFLHPIVVELDQKGSKELTVVADQRPSTRWNEAQYEHFIKNVNEYNFVAVRSYLQDLWINDNPELLLNNSKFAMQVYARLISETITRSLGLNPQDQLIIAVLASYFYCCLHTNQEHFNELEMTRLYGMISRAVNADMNTVMEIIEHIEPIHNVEDFCNTVKSVTGNVRLDKFNWGILFSLLFNSWYGGTNSKELISAAIEHPPTWVAIVMASLNDRSYKNTNIGKISLGMKADQSQSFIHAINNLLSTVK